MTGNQKYYAREMGFQIQRDFQFHLNEVLDITDLQEFISSGNQAATDKELNRLTVLYSDKIKHQAGSNYC